jgi:hypothetical protein
MRGKDVRTYTAIDFLVRLNKKYIGQFSYRVGILSGIRHLLQNSALLIARIVRYFHIPALLDIHGHISL